MAELLEQIEKSKKIIAELVERLHIPGNNPYENYAHSRNYSLLIKFSGMATRIPDINIQLRKKPAAFTPRSKMGPGERTLMAFTALFEKDRVDLPVANSRLSCIGNGNMDEVVRALEEIKAQFVQVVDPAKAIIQKFLPEDGCKQLILALDVGDAMINVLIEPEKGYQFSLYRGAISKAIASVKIEFDKDFQALRPMRVEGELEAVYRSMEVALNGIQQGKFTIVKRGLIHAEQ